MTGPAPHGPYDYALVRINNTTASLGNIEQVPGGRPRDLDGPTAIGVLTVHSNLAIASALLAVADALRSQAAAGQEG